jgi:hypothetical protein
MRQLDDDLPQLTDRNTPHESNCSDSDSDYIDIQYNPTTPHTKKIPTRTTLAMTRHHKLAITHTSHLPAPTTSPNMKTIMKHLSQADAPHQYLQTTHPQNPERYIRSSSLPITARSHYPPTASRATHFPRQNLTRVPDSSLKTSTMSAPMPRTTSYAYTLATKSSIILASRNINWTHTNAKYANPSLTPLTRRSTDTNSKLVAAITNREYIQTRRNCDYCTR